MNRERQRIKDGLHTLLHAAEIASKVAQYQGMSNRFENGKYCGISDALNYVRYVIDDEAPKTEKEEEQS